MGLAVLAPCYRTAPILERPLQERSMPVKKIKVHVSGNNQKDGVLNVRVQPWRVRLDTGDVVHWELETNGPAANDILWFRVEQIDQNHTWPFGTTAAEKPPNPAYTAIAPNGK